ncbi:PucR family transcriptional regulator ligand-binding domain-containing protein [Lactiplantibacillus daoliensis]|uniref:PucR family transcriptional regulator ligand-binding domain-containing protein n=1 Tax=Lactiplantibacillus daoliensis TaxID=2559916 RepID=A0ABW1UET4_9LACO|nr:PucR family transcriptional regulator [Lactiplantibacillus daoliensis]
MSLTVAEVLKLPSLKGAQVLAGRSALTKTVGSVSVLEYSQPSLIQTEIYQHIKFNTDEIILTAFASIRDDVEAQCQNIETLAAAGEIGVVWFYVGLIVPEIQPEVLELADRLSFLIICMPKNEPNLTYSSVISEILYSVYNDQLVHPNFATELIEQVSTMPSYRQNFDMVSRLLSNRLKVSVALTDQNQQLLSSQQWPPTNTLDWSAVFTQTVDGNSYQLALSPTRQVTLYRERGQLSKTMQQQAFETLRIALNLWDNHDLANNQSAELVAAIMQNQPQKLTQLLTALQLEPAQLRNLLIIHPLAPVTNPTEYQQQMRKTATNYVGRVICEWYQGELVLLPLADLPSYHEWEAWQAALNTDTTRLKVVSTRFTSLSNLAELSGAYAANQHQLKISRQIFPLNTAFTDNELTFAADCQRLIKQSPAKLTKKLQSLHDLSTDLLKTLRVFLLDAKGNVEVTAQQLFVHRNTAKYRLSKLDDYFGFKVGSLPESIQLYQLVAIDRLLTK